MSRIKEILDALPDGEFLAGETQFVKQFKFLNRLGYVEVVGRSDKAHGYVSIWRKTGKIPEDLKVCATCKRKLKSSMFCESNKTVDGLDWQCKDCHDKAPWYRRKHLDKEHARASSTYMHDVVGLRIMKKLYPSIEETRQNLLGYTHRCGKKYTLSFRCACRFQRMPPRGKIWVGGWFFNINPQRLLGADVLFLLAFDDRDSQKLLHIWKICKDDLPKQKVLTIFESNIDKYRKWEISLAEVQG